MEQFDFVGRFEALDADLPVVLARIFGGEEGTFVSAGPPPTQAGRRLKQHFTEYEADLIARLYACDFEYLGYDKRLPVGD